MCIFVRLPEQKTSIFNMLKQDKYIRMLFQTGGRGQTQRETNNSNNSCCSIIYASRITISTVLHRLAAFILTSHHIRQQQQTKWRASQWHGQQ